MAGCVFERIFVMNRHLLMCVLFALLAGGAQAQPFDNWVSAQCIGFNASASKQSCFQDSLGMSKEGSLDSGDGVPLDLEPPPVAAPVAEVNPEPLPELALAALAKPVPLDLTATAFFETYQAGLQAEGKAELDDLVSKLGGLNWDVLKVVGYADSSGSDAINRRLSVRRAQAVKDYLVGKGLPENQILVDAKGATDPLADNSTPAGRAKNRRVEVVVVGTTQPQ
jgi:OmpA-OmpF porin, OOP family